MRRIAIQIGLVLALLLFELPALAQGNMTVEYKPVNVRHLAGVVTYADGQGIVGAIVEDCDPTFKQVLGSATTDRNGRFSFPHAKYGSIHYLNVRYPGLDLTRIPVTIRLFAKAELRLHLIPGT
jgi:hypothetical protein